MRKELHHNTEHRIALPIQNVTAAATIRGPVIDVQGFGLLEFIIQFGLRDTGSYRFILEHANSPAFVNPEIVPEHRMIPGHDMGLAESTLSIAYLVGMYRYVRLVMVANPADSGVALSAIALLGNPLISKPVMEAVLPRTNPDALLWWGDATDATSVIREEDRVTTWQDKGSHQHHAVQSLPANQPVYLEEGINGLPALQCDAKTLKLPIEASALHDSFTLFCVLQRNQGIQTPVLGPELTNEVYLIGEDDKQATRFFNDELNGNESLVGPCVTTLIWTGEQWTFVVNRQVDAVLDAKDPVSHGELIIGSLIAENDLRIGEMRLYNTVLTQVERESIETALMHKWSILLEGGMQ